MSPKSYGGRADYSSIKNQTKESKMICSSCFKAEYKTITRITYLAPGKYAEVEAEFCPKCGDLVYTHDQSVELDKARRKVLPLP